MRLTCHRFPPVMVLEESLLPKGLMTLLPQNWKYQWIKLRGEIIITIILSKVWFRVAFLKILTQGLYCLTLGKRLPPPSLSFLTCRMGRLTGCSETLPLASASSILGAEGSSGLRQPWEAHCEWPRGVVLKEMNSVHNFYQCRTIQMIK